MPATPTRQSMQPGVSKRLFRLESLGGICDRSNSICNSVRAPLPAQLVTCVTQGQVCTMIQMLWMVHKILNGFSERLRCHIAGENPSLVGNDLFDQSADGRENEWATSGVSACCDSGLAGFIIWQHAEIVLGHQLGDLIIVQPVIAGGYMRKVDQ